MKQIEIINLTNLLSINSLFNHNKTNMESLIKETEQITGCNLRSRSSSERSEGYSFRDNEAVAFKDLQSEDVDEV